MTLQIVSLRVTELRILLAKQTARYRQLPSEIVRTLPLSLHFSDEINSSSIQHMHRIPHHYYVLAVRIHLHYDADQAML